MENHVAAAIDYTYVGAQGWQEWMSDLFEAFADGACFRLIELIAASEDFVAATFQVDGHSVWTQRSLQLSWSAVTWFRHGNATRIAGHASAAAALTAVTRTQI